MTDYDNSSDLYWHAAVEMTEKIARSGFGRWQWLWHCVTGESWSRRQLVRAFLNARLLNEERVRDRDAARALKEPR